MNKEIKEILDRLDYDEWEVDLYKVPITWCELYNIRDYITNLQEENERLKKPDYYEKGLIGSIKERDEIIQDYKSRNEKAIEYVEHHKFNKFGDIDCGEAEEIINILNGDDE